MVVSISCAGCSEPIKFSDLACRACGRELTPPERHALEARFEASNADYRDAKAAANRGLTVSLVTGLLTLFSAGVRLLLLFRSRGDFVDPPSVGGALVDALIGATLVICFFTGPRARATSLWVATGVAHVALVLPYFLGGPTRALLQFISPGNLALTLARLAALILLIQGLSAALVMNKLLRRRAKRA